MPIRNVPLWLDRYPKSRRPSYPRFRGDLEADVVIVGGGLTGCVCAWSFAGAGVKTILLEADSIGRGGNRGVRGPDPRRLRRVVSRNGSRARPPRGADDVADDAAGVAGFSGGDSARRCQVRPGAVRLPDDRARGAESARLLQREYQSRRDAGLDHVWLKPAAVTRDAAALKAAARSGPMVSRSIRIAPAWRFARRGRFARRVVARGLSGPHGSAPVGSWSRSRPPLALSARRRPRRYCQQR